MAATSSTRTAQPDSACLIETVAQAMQKDAALEAVQVHRDKEVVSVATMGRHDVVALDVTLGERLQKLRETATEPPCHLLQGGQSCAGCPAEKTSGTQPGLMVTHQADTTTIARVTCPTAPSFWRWHDLPFPKIVPRTVEVPQDEHGENEWKLQLVAAAVCGVFGIAGHFIPHPMWSLACFVISYLAGGWYALEEVLENLRKGVLDVHFLMLAVAAGSAAIGGWAEGATLLFLFSLSGALEHYALGRTQKEIRSLFKDAPKTATVLRADGHEEIVPVESLQVGLRLLVKPGEAFPVDGEIRKGTTASDESNLTGEAIPVEKQIGDTVFAGTINMWGAVEIIVTKPAGQSALQRIIHLIREAQQQRAPSQNFTDKFGTRYTYGVLGMSLAMFFVWWLGFQLPAFASTAETKSAFYRTMSLLVVASPCALVLSIPSAILAAIAWAAKRGILFRGGAAVEKLAEIQVVALDKTGTLTTGDLKVDRIESFPAGREREVAELAWHLERLSTHPLARAITHHGKQQGFQQAEVPGFESVTGRGLKGRVAGLEALVGKREWVMAGDAPASALPEHDVGTSEVWVRAGTLIGRLVLRDEIRPQSAHVIQQLNALGMHPVVLTGDRKAAAEKLVGTLGEIEIRAELSPEQKVEAITGFNKQGRKAAMVGDGVNDAPCLAAAHVGIAMGARGSDAALEQADIVLMHDRLENVLTACLLSRRAKAIIKQNLIISLGTVVVLVVFALSGSIPLTLAVVGHEGSTVVVVLNSLRLLFGKNTSA
ncbi:MAG: heavy metal translocating P-type ATPase [Verrucomicrobiota bacterium]